MARGPGTPLAFELTARSAYNGLILWRRPLPAGTHVVRSLMVGYGDELLLLEGPARAPPGRRDGPGARRDCRCPARTSKANGWPWPTGGWSCSWARPTRRTAARSATIRSAASSSRRARVGFGSQIVALDPASGAARWRHEAPAPVDGRSLAIAGGRVFYHAPGRQVACLDLVTGGVRWTQRNPEVLGALRGESKWLDITVGLEARPAVVATAAALYLFPPEAQTLVALSAQDGSRLWQAGRRGGRAMHALIAGDRLLAESLDLPGIVDALTGKPTGQRFSAGGCGVFCASPRVLCAQAGGAMLRHGAGPAAAASAAEDAVPSGHDDRRGPPVLAARGLWLSRRLRLRLPGSCR